MADMRPTRCPFESQGIDKGSIPEFVLAATQEERLRVIQGALMRLRLDLEGTSALRFVLPDALLSGCENTRVLKHRILPYQAEIAAADLDMRLRPLLWFHKSAYGEAFVRAYERGNTGITFTATWFKNVFESQGFPPPPSLAHLAVWIETVLATSMKKDLRRNPQMTFTGEHNGKQIPLITIDPSGVVLHLERGKHKDPAVNRNCFCVVKCPLYPQTFWRYSERLEIVMTREADFTQLSTEVRERIRVQSNEIYREARVAVDDDTTFKPPAGLWQVEFTEKI